MPFKLLRAENFVVGTALEFLSTSTGSALYRRWGCPLMGHEYGLGFGLDFLIAETYLYWAGHEFTNEK